MEQQLCRPFLFFYLFDMRWGGAAMNNWDWMKCYSDDDTFYKILVTPQIKSVKKKLRISTQFSASHTVHLTHVLALGCACSKSCSSISPLFTAGASPNLPKFYKYFTHSTLWVFGGERDWEPRGKNNQPLYIVLHLRLVLK